MLMIPVFRKGQNNQVPLAVEASAHSSADTKIDFQAIGDEKDFIMKKMQQCSVIYRCTLRNVFGLCEKMTD